MCYSYIKYFVLPSQLLSTMVFTENISQGLNCLTASPSLALYVFVMCNVLLISFAPTPFIFIPQLIPYQQNISLFHVLSLQCVYQYYIIFIYIQCQQQHAILGATHISDISVKNMIRTVLLSFGKFCSIFCIQLALAISMQLKVFDFKLPKNHSHSMM